MSKPRLRPPEEKARPGSASLTTSLKRAATAKAGTVGGACGGGAQRGEQPQRTMLILILSLFCRGAHPIISVLVTSRG